MFSLLFRARTSSYGRPVSILLPEFPMPGLRPPRRRKSHRHRPTRQVPAVSLALLPHLPRPVLRTQGYPAVPRHLPEDKILSILEHIHEGCGVLKTARLVKVHPDTVSHYSRASGAHARDAHDELVAHSPQTRELQMDEKWSFVAKKEKNCDEDDPEDQFRGDCWDHVAFDPEHRLVVSVVPGERTGESVRELVTDVKERLGGRAPELITTDEYTAYEGAILEAFGTKVVPPRTGKPGRPRKPYKVAPAGLHYATVHKTRKKGRVVDVVTQVIFGTAAAVEAALVKSGVSHRINTAFVERHNGTDRNRNAGRCGRRIASRRTGGFIARSRSSRCTVTTSAGR